jgi:hypothetical protein
LPPLLLLLRRRRRQRRPSCHAGHAVSVWRPAAQGCSTQAHAHACGTWMGRDAPAVGAHLHSSSWATATRAPWAQVPVDRATPGLDQPSRPTTANPPLQPCVPQPHIS